MVQSRSLRLLSIGEILRLPNPSWLIEDVIPENSLVLLYGKPGSGKSFLALDWSLRIAAGEPWLNRHKVMQGISVFVAAEGTAGLRKRLKAYMANHAKLGEGAPFLAVTKPIDLFNSESVGEFIQAVNKERDRLGKPVRSIVFDTLARCTPGADENAAKDMGLVIANLDRVRHELGSPAILPIHHDTKAGGGVRGSSSLAGAADTIIRQAKVKDLITLVCEKQKDSDLFSKINLVTRQVPTGEEDERGRPITSLVLGDPNEARTEESTPPNDIGPEPSGLADKAKQALNVLRKHGSLSWSEWQKATNLSNGSLGHVVNELKTAGAILQEKKGGPYSLKAESVAA